MLLLFLSPRFEFSANVFVVFVDDAATAVDRVIGGIAFFKCKFNGNGLFSLSKLRGNCIVVSSLISVDDASTRFDDEEDAVEFFVFTPDEDEEDEFRSTVRRSDVSDNGRGGGGGANG